MGSGGIGKASAPAPADFTGAATPTQANAFGATSNWTQGPDGKWSQNQSFQGPLGDAAKGMEGQAANAWKTPLDNGAQARDSAQQAIYGREQSMLDPQWNERQSQFNSQMAAQGLMPGSEAYDRAAKDFNNARTFAYSNAQNQAIIGGGQEAQRQQQMDINSRMAPMQGLEGLAGLTGQSQNPLLPAAIAQYQGQLQQYSTEQEGKNSMMSGLMGMGGTIGGAALMPKPR